MKFRTRFCERFLQYGECNFGGKCQYSHNMTWRRRSPQKYLYEPRLCDNIITYVSDSGKKQTMINCHNGKNCKFAHSREEVLFHPALYKTVMCEDPACTRYYCPFAHSVDELVPTNEPIEYIKRCLTDVMDNEDEDDEFGTSGVDTMQSPDLFDATAGTSLIGGLRIRKAAVLSSGVQPNPTPMGNRLYLPLPGSSDWNISDLSAWISISPAIRIETVVRAHSPVVSSELCRAIISRNAADNGGPSVQQKKSAPNANNSNSMNQYCLAKVIQLDASNATDQILNDLSLVSKTEHKNLLSLKKLHVGQLPGSTSSMLCIAFEQSSTSLYQAIVDGYRNGTEQCVRGLAKKLNPHNGSTTTTAVQRIADMIAGVQRLHFMNIAHMRLCPTNVLIDNESTFKISDFLGKYGLMTPSSSGGSLDNVSNSTFPPPSVVIWQPSEIITELKQNSLVSLSSVQKLKKVDIFSLGCCVFYAMTGQHPYGTFATGDRFAAGGACPPAVQQSSLFVNGTGDANEVIENIHADYIANQHLLYNCPLVLDLVLRCLCLNPADRLDSGELSRHPLFWDFDTIRTFILSLPMENEVFRKFCHYELDWKPIVAATTSTSSSIDKYDSTIYGIVEFLIESWNSTLSSSNFRAADSPFPTTLPPAAMMAPMSSLWLRILDRFPHVLIRVWDGVKIVNSKKYVGTSQYDESVGKIFQRNHLHWMILRSAAITSISHSYVREYYLMVNGVLGPGSFDMDVSLVFPDESSGLSDACRSHCAAVVASIKAQSSAVASRSLPCSNLRRPIPTVSQGLPRFSAVQQPSVTPPAPILSVEPCGTPGMTFVDPLIVKQMAAASAALSAVYENPDLVRAIAKDHDPSDPHSQLVAAVSIYASLLEQGGQVVTSQPNLAGARTSSIW